MALRAAHNAGISVPKKTFKRAVEYVKQSKNRDGGFMYMISAGGESALPRSAAAIVALNSAGIYQTSPGTDSAIVTKGLDYLTQFCPKDGVVRHDESYFEYGHYYAVQAMWQAGGERWAKWYPAVRDELLRRQRTDGSWFSAYGASTRPPCACWSCKCRKTSCPSSSVNRPMNTYFHFHSCLCVFALLREIIGGQAFYYRPHIRFDTTSRPRVPQGDCEPIQFLSGRFLTQRRKAQGREWGAKNETKVVPCVQFIFLLLSIHFCLTTKAIAQIPLAVPVDRDPFHAKLTDVDAQWRLSFDVAGGVPARGSRTLAAADLVAWGHPAELRKGPVIVLADGGRLVAAVVDADKTRSLGEFAAAGALKLPLDSLAGIVFRTPPNAQELDALLDRISRGEGRTDGAILDNGDEVAGLIETLSGEKLAIKGDLGLLDVAMPRVVAVIFNPALRQAAAAQPGAAWAGLSDGTRLLAERMTLKGGEMEMTEIGSAVWKAKAEDLVFLMPQSDRAVFLSDIRPDEYRFLPYLEMKWPYRTDRNVTGGQLRSGGLLYLKGLGVHGAAAELQARPALVPLPGRNRHRRLDGWPGKRGLPRLRGRQGEVRQSGRSRRNRAAADFRRSSQARSSWIWWLITARRATCWTTPIGSMHGW